MPNNLIAFDGVVVERGFFQLGSSNPTYRQLCGALDIINAAISEADDAIARHRNPEFVANDSERLAGLRLAAELIDRCLK